MSDEVLVERRGAVQVIIINRPRVMGKYVNTPLANVVGWGTAVIIGVLALVYVWQSIASG